MSTTDLVNQLDEFASLDFKNHNKTGGILSELSIILEDCIRARTLTKAPKTVTNKILEAFTQCLSHANVQAGLTSSSSFIQDKYSELLHDIVTMTSNIASDEDHQSFSSLFDIDTVNIFLDILVKSSIYLADTEEEHRLIITTMDKIITNGENGIFIPYGFQFIALYPSFTSTEEQRVAITDLIQYLATFTTYGVAIESIIPFIKGSITACGKIFSIGWMDYENAYGASCIALLTALVTAGTNNEAVQAELTNDNVLVDVLTAFVTKNDDSDNIPQAQAILTSFQA